MLSSSSDEEEVNQRPARSAFLDLNLFSDSDDSSDSDDDITDSDAKKMDAQGSNNKQSVEIVDGFVSDDRESSFVDTDDDEEQLILMQDDDAQKRNELLEFDDLVNRSTRHDTIVQPDFAEAITQYIGRRDSKNTNGSTSRMHRPTDIQRECWATMLSPLTRGRDVIAISKTGSGKTLAFLVPLLASMATPSSQSRNVISKTNMTDGDDPTKNKCVYIYPRAIILAPTRVLAQQIFEVASTLVQNTPSLSTTGGRKVKVSVILGGTAYHQQMTTLLAEDPDIIIATPGRLNSLCGYNSTACKKKSSTTDDNDDDFAHYSNSEAASTATTWCVKLDNLCELVIDEADTMLALGFQNAISWFAQLVNHATRMKRTSSESASQGFRLVLTSATWEAESNTSLSLFETISKQPPVFLTAASSGKEQMKMVTKNVTQRVEVLAHKGAPRFNYLVKLLIAALSESSPSSRIIVFCPYKSQTRQIGKDLRAKGGIENLVLEGDMSQSARVTAIKAFRNGARGCRVLVATDVAARGLDVLSVSHIFNYSLGISIESYIHRCGRTGRAGQFGVAHTFVVKGVDEALSPELCSVLKQTSQSIPDDLRIMSGKEIKKRNREAGVIATTPKNEEERADMEEILEQRKENRERQTRNKQKNQRCSKKNDRRRRGRN